MLYMKRFEYKSVNVWLVVSLVLGVCLLSLICYEFIVCKNQQVGVSLWDVMTSLSTLLAVVAAFMAYGQSQRTRQQASFDAVFAQLLNGLLSFVNNPALQKIRLNEPANVVDINQYGAKMSVCIKDTLGKIRKCNAYLGFCRLYKEVSSHNGNRCFTLSDIKQIWDMYSEALIYKAVFQNCFKYIYHMVDAVVNSSLDKDEKKRYIGIIQAQLNLDILFCYFINQIVMNGDAVSEFTKILKEYDFFKNLFEDHIGYGKYIADTVPYQYYECFRGESK